MSNEPQIDLAPQRHREPERPTQPERPTRAAKRWLSVSRPTVPVRLLAGLFLLALVAVIAIILVMNRQQSPEDVQRARRAPIVRPITVKLVRQVLEVSFMDSQASYRYANPRPVTLAGSLAKTGATQVVTQGAVEGQLISDNQVLMSVAGRPVIGVQVYPVTAAGLPCVDGDRACAVVPMYRDLRPGHHGQDVAQLQSVLKRLGLLTEVSGRYGPTTSIAVAAWYESLGLEPFDIADGNGSANANANARPGEIIPANEVLFFRELPLRVDEVTAVVGGAITSDSVFTATGTKLVVASQIPVEKIQYVHKGMRVSLIDQNSAVSTGTVERVATKPGGTATDGLYAVEILTNTPVGLSQDKSRSPNLSYPNQAPGSRSVGVGLPLTVNYPVQRSTEPLLAVPVTGLFPCSADQPGTECVRVTSDSGDSFYEVRITRIMTSSIGLVGFEQPVASVKEGDIVLINSPAPSRSDAKPGPEDLGELSNPPATVLGDSRQPPTTSA